MGQRLGVQIAKKWIEGLTLLVNAVVYIFQFLRVEHVLMFLLDWRLQFLVRNFTPLFGPL